MLKGLNPYISNIAEPAIPEEVEEVDEDNSPVKPHRKSSRSPEDDPPQNDLRLKPDDVIVLDFASAKQPGSHRWVIG